MANAMCVSLSFDDDGPGSGDEFVGERKVASTISSLKPMSWRDSERVESEWKRMFWSAWTDTNVEVVGTWLGSVVSFILLIE